MPGSRVLGVVDRLDLLNAPCGPVLDHEQKRPQHGHRPCAAPIEVLAEAVLQQLDVDGAIVFAIPTRETKSLIASGV